MLTFIIGMMVGGIVGFFAFCLLTAGKDSDRYTEYEAREVFGDTEHDESCDGVTEVKPDDPK